MARAVRPGGPGGTTTSAADLAGARGHRRRRRAVPALGAVAALPVGPHRHAVGRSRAAGRGGHPVAVRPRRRARPATRCCSACSLLVLDPARPVRALGRLPPRRARPRHAARRPADAPDRRLTMGDRDGRELRHRQRVRLPLPGDPRAAHLPRRRARPHPARDAGSLPAGGGALIAARAPRRRPQRRHRPHPGRPRGRRDRGRPRARRPGDHVPGPARPGPDPRAARRTPTWSSYPDFSSTAADRLGRLHRPARRGRPGRLRRGRLERAGSGRHLVRLVRLVQDPRGHLRAGAQHDAPGPARTPPTRSWTAARSTSSTRRSGASRPPRAARARARRSWPG